VKSYKKRCRHCAYLIGLPKKTPGWDIKIDQKTGEVWARNKKTGKSISKTDDYEEWTCDIDGKACKDIEFCDAVEKEREK
jgi:hypothetical protein